MSVPASCLSIVPRPATAMALLVLALSLSGCASVSDTVSVAFADPAKYDLWDCKQLEPERKGLADRLAKQQALMAKAETGVGGAVVAEVAYRNEYIAIRGQQKYAEDAWRRNKCHETAPAATAPGPAGPAPATGAAPALRSGNAVY